MTNNISIPVLNNKGNNEGKDGSTLSWVMIKAWHNSDCFLQQMTTTFVSGEISHCIHSSVYLSLHAGMDFNDTQPFEVTMAAGTTVVTAGIPIVDDEINEAGEEFVVVLEVVSNITNPVEFTAQTTVCRIPQNDRKY